MLIGQPKTLDEFPALTPDQVAHLATPVLQALHMGHPLDVAVQIDFGAVCQLLATVKHLGAEVERLTVLVPKQEAPSEEPPAEAPFPTFVRPFASEE